MQYLYSSEDDQQSESEQHGKYGQKQRRKLVVWTCACYAVSLLALCLTWWGVQNHLWVDMVAYIVAVLPSIACFLLELRLYSSTQNIILKKDRQLDERQKMVRNSAFRQAFIISSYLFLILILLDLFFGLSFLAANIMPRVELFFNLLLFINGLPVVIIAWKEKKI